MQNVSSTYERVQASTDKWYESRLKIANRTYLESHPIFSIETNIEMFRGTPTVGNAVAGEVDIEMAQPTTTIPRMAKIEPQVRACGSAAVSSECLDVGNNGLRLTNATYANENITINSPVTVNGENIIFKADSEEYLESEWIPQGVYFVDTREVTANQNNLDVLTLQGYDAMLKAEQDYSGTVAGDNYDTAYVSAIAAAIGVSVDDRTWEIMGTGYVIPFPIGYSMRQILGYIAASYAGCFIITDEGKLRLVAINELPAETNLLIDEYGDTIIFGDDAILV